MKIAMIGAGNLATNLGRALHNAGHDFVSVYSRTMESAATLAAIVGGAATTSIAAVTNDADIYIIALKDSVLADIIPQLCNGRQQKIFVHTAGSMPMDVFHGMALHYGVIYPMQTFSRQREVDFSVIPIFLEANDELTLNAISGLATSVSNDVSLLDSPSRRYLHLAAVFACNFSNHCYALAADVLKKVGLDFSVMLPLIDETARKVHDMSPEKAQTGPAVRYDDNVIRSQAQMLRDNPFAKDIYERMSVSINKKSKCND